MGMEREREGRLFIQFAHGIVIARLIADISGVAEDNASETKTATQEFTGRG
jgi:hypothetical protein